MKTADLMTMLSTALLLLASLAVEGSAVPLHPHIFGEELAEREQGAIIDDNPYSQHQRDMRAVPPIVSDYATTVFRNRQSWRNSKCKSTFNCAPVSPQHCGDSNELIFFCPNKSSIHPYGCELDFKIEIDAGGTAEGLELALYKKSEPNADEHLIYYIYIVYKPSGATSYSSVVVQRSIRPSCSSWQVFNISSIKNNFPPGVHEITLLVAAFRGSTDINDGQAVHMDCEETRSLFVMDPDADINQFISQPDPPVQSGGKTEHSVVEENQSDVNKTQKQNEENNNQTQEGVVDPNKKEGSGKEAEELEQDTTEKYLPSLSVYVSGTETLFLSKRSLAESTSSEQIFTEVVNGKDDDDQASGGNECKRIEKKIFLPEYISGALQPQRVDIGQCMNSTDISIECKPSKYAILEILRKIGEHLKIQTIDNLIITECSPSMYNNNPHDQPISVA